MKPFVSYLIAASCALTPVALLTTVCLGWSAQNTPALADDDDNDDGGGATSSGQDQGAQNDDGVRPKKKLKRKSIKRQRAVKRKAPRRARAAPQLPLRAPAEIIARDITTSDLESIEQAGYREIARRILANGQLIVRLRVPRGWSLARARDQIARITSNSQIDFNHYYRPRQEIADNAGAPLVAVGWQPSLVLCSGLPVIGIIDSHIDKTHPVLQYARVETLEIIDQDLKPARDGHGTAVAALIAGAPTSQSPGLLPGAELVAINVFHQGSENDIRTDAFSLVSAVEEMRRRNVKIVNMSLTGPANVALEQAIAEAHAIGVFLAAATGNDGPRAKPLFPAGYEGVVAVTAIDEKKKVYRRAGQGRHVDLAAPGVKIRSAGPKGKVTMHTGSSFAVPFVAAAAALHMSKGSVDAKTATDLLNTTAVDLGKKGRDPVYGAGLVQLPTDCK